MRVCEIKDNAHIINNEPYHRGVWFKTTLVTNQSEEIFRHFDSIVIAQDGTKEFSAGSLIGGSPQSSPSSFK